MPDDAYRFVVYENPCQVPAPDWDCLVAADPDGNAFVSHAYLCALQQSGAATPEAGWIARFLTLWHGDALAAAVPLYAKAHSYGEYVFDWAWADALERAGAAYYPKWLVAVPFTPVAGSRILARDAAARAAAVAALLAFTRQSGLSSLHVLFAPGSQIALLAGQDMLVRSGVQFHWHNPGYRDFGHFLDALSQPKRKKIRAERRKVAEAGVSVEQRAGRDIHEDDWRFFVRCYEHTYAQHGAPPYLNEDFFLRISRTMPQNLLLVLARRGGQRIASALGVIDRRSRALYGRYWGALEAVPCLHFECCYYAMIDFAIAEGLQTFEGGAQGAHKLARGLDPVATQSAHWLREPAMQRAVRRFLDQERTAVAETIDELGEHRALRTARAPLTDGENR